MAQIIKKAPAISRKIRQIKKLQGRKGSQVQTLKKEDPLYNECGQQRESQEQSFLGIACQYFRIEDTDEKADQYEGQTHFQRVGRLQQAHGKKEHAQIKRNGSPKQQIFSVQEDGYHKKDRSGDRQRYQQQMRFLCMLQHIRGIDPASCRNEETDDRSPGEEIIAVNIVGHFLFHGWLPFFRYTF